MSKNRQITIVDIAEAAGVSIATVSNVLNRRKVPMSEGTIRKVEKIAEELGYRRNVMAANLSRRKSFELGLMIPNYDAYYGRFAEEMERTAHRFGYHMSVFSAGGYDPDMEKRHLEVLLQRRVDGLFCHGLAMTPETTRQIVGDGTPLVLFNAWDWPQDIAIHAVNLNFADGCVQAVHHLVEQGCEALIYLSSVRSKATNEQRLKGFRQGLAELHKASVASGIVDLGGKPMTELVKQTQEISGERDPSEFWHLTISQLFVSCQPFRSKAIGYPSSTKFLESIMILFPVPVIRLSQHSIFRIASRPNTQLR